MSALGCFGRFTLFHHLSHLPKHLPCLCLFLLVFGVWVCLLLCRVFVSCFASVMESRILRALDLDDRQGLIASSAMQ